MNDYSVKVKDILNRYGCVKKNGGNHEKIFMYHVSIGIIFFGLRR